MKVKNKCVWILGAAVVAVMVGCGDSGREQTPVIQSMQPPVMTQLGSGSIYNAFGQPGQNGMFDATGTERVQTQLGQPTQPYPQERHWFTRIEFLKQDGTVVEPFSFTMPLGIHLVRISLINDAQSTIKYVAEGTVYVMSTRGYALTDWKPMRAYMMGANGAATPVFDLKFGLGLGTGPMLGVKNTTFQGSLFGGVIVLIEPSGKHIIQY